MGNPGGVDRKEIWKVILKINRHEERQHLTWRKTRTVRTLFKKQRKGNLKLLEFAQIMQLADAKSRFSRNGNPNRYYLRVYQIYRTCRCSLESIVREEVKTYE